MSVVDYTCTIVLCQGVVTLPAFSERLVQLREAAHLQQRAVADGVGVAIRTYQYYERGEREPQLSTLVRIADFYGVSLDYLAGRSDEK